ncbi:hypothetical protein GGX14DRAFT_561949 [Mycena pura]|uniref:Uncharacterized protein n=1 Tax=Mycena pura TaxID=153505 RepID=A0AAD6VMQ1_9AGAR|nr:hypothetical protein GGX14DRAFT_561949 [Mycena pura]
MDIKSSLLPALQIPPITSTISRLILAMEQRVDLDHSAQALGEIFASLTLPYLQEFELQGFCFTWPHGNFLALCERSSFRRCLKTLGVSHVVITEKELLQVLSALGSLEYLHIADQPLREGEVKVITDSFLLALTVSSASVRGLPLLPRLRHFSCISLLCFTNDIFKDFITSRLDACSPRPFQITIKWYSHTVPGFLQMPQASCRNFWLAVHCSYTA